MLALILALSIGQVPGNVWVTAESKEPAQPQVQSTVTHEVRYRTVRFGRKLVTEAYIVPLAGTQSAPVTSTSVSQPATFIRGNCPGGVCPVQR